MTFKIRAGNQESILRQSDNIAAIILRDYEIINRLGQNKRINTIEFYISCPQFQDGKSKGGATHEREEQKTTNSFYIHTKAKTEWALPAFNRAGIDITCGSIKGDCYGGILIREIDNPWRLKKEGSARTVRAILRGDIGYDTIRRGSEGSHWTNNEKEILSLLNKADVFNNQLNIVLKKMEHKNIPIYKGPREGIKGKIFEGLPLRYTVHNRKGFQEL